MAFAATLLGRCSNAVEIFKNTPKKRVRFGSRGLPRLDCGNGFSAHVLFSKRGLAYFSLVFHSKLLRSMAWCNYGSMNDWWVFFFLSPPALSSSFHAVSCEISKSGHVESGFSRLLLGNVACFALCNMQKQPIATSDELLLYKGLGNWVIPFFFFFC